LDKTKIIITREEIAKRVAELAAEISRDYKDKNPILIGVLKGSFIFMSDFIRLSSYSACTESSGRIRVLKRLDTPIKGRHVLVVEDIVDSGCTLHNLIDCLKRRKPASVKVCVLFDKPSRREMEVPIDYVGFTIPDAFVVGYGLDFGEKFRHLPDLCVLEE
jgi:hypoxanthine phosphoribosyltransferase